MIRATGWDAWRPRNRPASHVRILAALLLAIFVVALLVARARAEDQVIPVQARMCAPKKEVNQSLATAGEEPIVQGIATTGEKFQIWANPDGSTWTATSTRPQGLTCILGIGTALETRVHSKQRGQI